MSLEFPEKDADKACELFFMVSKKFGDRLKTYLIEQGRTELDAENEVQNMKFTIAVESFIGSVSMAIWRKYYFQS